MPRRAGQIVLRAGKRLVSEAYTDRAAALTYYSVLSIFPGLIALVALLALAGSNPGTSDALLDIVRDLGPESAAESLEGPVNDLVDQGATAGVAFAVGLVVALYTASNYVSGFTRAANAVFEVEEGRSVWKLRPQQVAITFLLIVLLAVVLVGLVLTGPIAEAVGERIGLGDDALTLYGVLKWPLLALSVVAIVSMLYTATPNVRRKRHRFISPGALVAVLVWALGSAAFAFYVSGFSSYDKTYGSLAGAIVFLVWLYLTNIALLLGLLIDAERERERELDAGLPAEEELQLPPREAAEA